MRYSGGDGFYAESLKYSVNTGIPANKKQQDGKRNTFLKISFLCGAAFI